MKDFSERRLVENELLFKQLNDEAKEFVLEGKSDGAWAHKKLRFYCECSNIDCRERIEITANEYDAIHSNRKRFIVKPGHDMPDIEQVVGSEVQYIVVEKNKMPPAPKQVDPIRFK
jgi:hypothetical protein